MTMTPVGIREFRENLADYAASDVPLAVTRHGRTIGFFIPVKTDLTAEKAAFLAAAEKLDALLSLEERESALAEFEALRREGRE